MKTYVTQATVHEGRISLDNVPLADESEVEVRVVPKTNIRKMSFQRVRELTKEARGSLAEDICEEREER